MITTIKRGGAENQLLVLVKEQVRAGFEVHVAYLKDEVELLTDFHEAGAIVHQDLSGLKPFKQPFALRKLILSEDFIVHAHLPRAELVGLFCPKRFKFITSRHNAEPFFPGAPRIFSNLLSRIVSFRALKIIAISNAVKEYLLRQGEIGNKGKIEVVHYGYTPHFNRSEIKQSSPGNVINIGTISRLSSQKDIPTMLKAFEQYLKIIPVAKLSILGSGPLENSLKALALGLNQELSISFLGRSARIYEFLGNLDAFILTSRYEGFGMVLLEAMDAGVPIIASRNSSIPEVLGNDFPGLCQTGDASDFKAKLEMLNDHEYRKNVMRIQEDRLAVFDSRTMARRISTIYFEQ